MLLSQMLSQALDALPYVSVGALFDFGKTPNPNVLLFPPPSPELHELDDGARIHEL